MLFLVETNPKTTAATSARSKQTNIKLHAKNKRTIFKNKTGSLSSQRRREKREEGKGERMKGEGEEGKGGGGEGRRRGREEVVEWFGNTTN